MRNRLRIILIAAFALLLVPAAWMIGRAPAQPADPAPQAVRACPNADLAAERACYQRVLHERLRAEGAGGALALLDRLAGMDADVRRDGHMYAHGIGLAALGAPDEVGRIFASCTPGWQSGCYHGVIQAYFLATRREGSGITAQSLDRLCAAYRGPRGDYRLMFQCAHGLGHGLTMFHGHDLRRALAGCDLLSRRNERDSCYGGAFMENIVNVTQPHHMAGEGSDQTGGHASHDAHGQHGQSGPAAAPAPAVEAWRPLDPNDLHYPCSAFAEKYLDACYTIQTAAMLYFAGQDVGRVARECGRAPEPVRWTCFVSLGRDVSTIAGPSMAEAVRLCGLAAAEFEPACNEGVVQAIINMNVDPAEGVPYCRAILSPASKALCYDIVGRQALALPNGAARRRQACRGAEPAWVHACLGRPAPMPGAVITAPVGPARGR